MSETNSETTDDFESAEAMLSGLHVITLSYDTSGAEPPELDLGDASPFFAAALFAQAIEALEMTFPYPRIKVDGKIYFDPYPNDDE